MPIAVRIVIDAAGTILEADELFSATLRQKASMVGANALQITAPGDRDRCARLIAQIVADHMPITTRKRLIRADGSNIWVENSLTFIGTPDDPRIAIQVEESQPPSGWVPPDKLLRLARLVFKSRRERADTFGSELFTDHAWDLLLSAYISEAEGSVVTIARLHAWAGISLTTGSRWIRALAGEGLLEYEGGGSNALVTTPFRLTSGALHKFESYLSLLYERGANGQEVEVS